MNTEEGGDNPKLLLSIDGGGIRGIIPAVLLVALERVTGRPARETFSFVAGTSTGAIIAAAIAAGIPARQILDIYVRRARDVFVPSPLRLPRRILSGSMYSIDRLHAVIRDELGSACDWRLNDAPVDLLLTAKRLSDGMPWYFVRDSPANAGTTGRLLLADCATASAAAPTYFKPWPVAPVGELVDGSLGVTGNPVYQACIEAFDYSIGYQPDRTIVVSLGTGRFATRRRPLWIWHWLEWVLGELLRSPGEQQTQVTHRMFPTMWLYRIDTRLPRSIGLDAVDQSARLRRIGEELAARVDWPEILSGRDTSFLIGRRNTLWQQYAQQV